MGLGKEVEKWSVSLKEVISEMEQEVKRERK
jgi:hypothetical protein